MEGSAQQQQQQQKRRKVKYVKQKANCVKVKPHIDVDANFK